MNPMIPVQARSPIISQPPMPFAEQVRPAIVDIVQVEPPRPDPGMFQAYHNNINPPGVTLPSITAIAYEQELGYLPESGKSFYDHNRISISKSPVGITYACQSKDNVISPDPGSYIYSSGKWWHPNVLPSSITYACQSKDNVISPDPGAYIYSSGKWWHPNVLPSSIADVISIEAPRPEDGRIINFHSYRSGNKITPSQNLISKQLSDPNQLHDGGFFRRIYTTLTPVIPSQFIKTQAEFVAFEVGKSFSTHGIAKLPVAHGFVIVSTEAPRLELYPALVSKPPYFCFHTASNTISKSEEPRLELYPAYASKTPYLYQTSFTPAKVLVASSEMPRLDFGSVFEAIRMPLTKGLPLNPIHVAKTLDNQYPDQGIVLSSTGILHANQIYPGDVDIIKTEERSSEDGRVVASHGRGLGGTNPYLKPIISISEAPQIINLSSIYARGFWYSNPYPAFKAQIVKLMDNQYPDQGASLSVTGVLHANPVFPGDVDIIKSQEPLPDNGRALQTHAIPTSSKFVVKSYVASSETPQLPSVIALYSTGLLLTNHWGPVKVPIARSEGPGLDLGSVQINKKLVPQPNPGKSPAVISKTEQPNPEIGGVIQSHVTIHMFLPGKITQPLTQNAPSVFGDGSSFSWFTTLAIGRILPYSGTVTIAKTEEPPPYSGWAITSFFIAGAPNSYAANLLVCYAAMSFQCGAQTAIAISG
jgi:hypothetical protein